MTALQVICAIVNFLVLAGGVWLFGGKILKKNVASALEGAERARIEASGCPEEIERRRFEENKRLAELAVKAEAGLGELKSASRTALENELCRRRNLLSGEREREMKALNRRVGYSTVKRVAQTVRALAAKEPYASECAKRTPVLARAAIDSVELTPADKMHIREGRGLSAEIASAYELDGKYVDILREKLSGEDISSIECFMYTDSELISGVRITVGDTLYDLSLLGALDRICARAEKLDAESLETALSELISGAGMEPDVRQLGRVIKVSDGICHVSGLSDVMAGEMLELPSGVIGMVLDLDENSVGCVLLGEYEHIHEGDTVRRTGLLMETPVGEALIGRVVNALGKPIDGGGAIYTEHYRALESPSPSVISRKSVSVPLQTGLKAIDALIPIGRGQRELIIGDRQTGKTAIAIDAIINQRGTGVICIYVAIGQKESTVAAVVDKLKVHNAMDYTIVVSANACEAAPMLYLAPYAGAAMGEYFMYGGKDVLIIYDDLPSRR